jgi:poly-gamma-glutamate synthesis protein (capsule biosynthesis protein)
VGDNLLHDSVSYSAQQADGSYDYSGLYAAVADVFRGSDIAFINQEVMLTGQVSAYPSIAAKAECADALKALGFNVINLATNHALDKGVSGLETCLQNVHDRNFDAVLGAFRSEDESKQQIILEKQGIRFGFLSYTYNINGSGLPAGKKWMVAKIDENKIRAEVTALRKECDYLIVSMHWGTEYQDKQSKTQEKQAKLLAELGVDLVIGSHPHVLQPAKWYDRPDGGKMYCTYSLGNFISNQRKWATMLGGILDITLEFDANNGALIAVKDAGIIPTVTHYNYLTTDGGITRGHQVILLEDYTEDLATAHGIKNWAGELTLSWLKKHANAVLGEHQRTWQK